MADLNEKDLEQATGGIQFIKPVFDGSDDGYEGEGNYYTSLKPVDLNGTCEMFERMMYATGSQSTCSNCRYLTKSSEDNNYYCKQC